MSIKDKIGDTSEIIKRVLSNRRYLALSIVSGILVFSLMYYFLVANVADNDIWISVMMSGAGYITWSIASIIAISTLFGIYVSLVVFKINILRSIGGGGLFGIVGGTIGAFGVGCPTCGAFVLGLIGMPLALMYLPFRGLELQTLSVFIMLISIYFMGKSINSKCAIGKFKKE